MYEERPTSKETEQVQTINVQGLRAITSGHQTSFLCIFSIRIRHSSVSCISMAVS